MMIVEFLITVFFAELAIWTETITRCLNCAECPAICPDMGIAVNSDISSPAGSNRGFLLRCS